MINLNVSLKLNLQSPTENEVKQEERVKEATKRKKASKETIEEAWERVSSLKYTEDQRKLFEIAKEGFFTGVIGRLTDKKLTKSEVLEMGRRLEKQQEEAHRQERMEKTLRTKPSNYYIVTDDSKLPEMMDRLREEVRLQQKDEWFGKVFELFNSTLIRRKLKARGIEIPAVVSLTVWDTETSGVDKYNDLTGGYSLWLPLLNEGYYVAYGHLTGEEQCTRSKALTAVKPFLELANHAKSFHNTEFDFSMFLNDGIQGQGFRYDSMDAQKILYDHEESYALKKLFTKYKKSIGGRALKLDDFTFEDLFGNCSPMIYPVEVVGIYAIKDVEKGWLLTKWQIDMMQKIDNLYVPYFEIRQYLPEVNVCIERTGFEIDLEQLKELEVEYRAKLEKAKNDLYAAYNIDDDFLYNMSMTIKGDKIKDWIEKQKQRIQRQDDMLQKCRKELEKTNPKTKKYQQLKERIRRYETEKLPEPIPQNALDYITEFNLSSNDHIGYLIYDYLGIKDITKKVVKDKSRGRAVSNDVLDIYFEEEASLKPLSEYSKFDKLLGTYVEKIPEALDIDGRLHTQLRTVSTGRYGSSGYSGKPNGVRPKTINDSNYLVVVNDLVHCDKKVSKGTNLQNIPARTEEGVRVRKCFIPKQGYTFIGSDLSSIEPRIQAHRMAKEFNDDKFAEMYQRGLDPYVEFASILFEVPREICLEDYYRSVKDTEKAVIPYRKIMKQLFLAIGYGQAFDQFYKSVHKHGIGEVQALRAFNKFDEILPGFKQMVQSTYSHLRKHGWTATIFHQKRRFPEYKRNWQHLCFLMKRAGIKDKNDPDLAKKSYKLSSKERTQFWDLIRKTGRDERAAFNHTIQGSGANVLQLCMIRMYYECTAQRGWEFNLTLHDEVKESIPNEELTLETVKLFDDIMTNTVELATPLKCDTVIEPVWMEEYSADEWDFENCCPNAGH